MTPWMHKLRNVLARWKRTPYQDCGHWPQVGACCYGFIVEVMNELHRMQVKPRGLPRDMAMNSPTLAAKYALRMIKQFPCYRLPPICLYEPGDVLLIGRVGVIGHGMIVDAGNRVWHADLGGVCYSGLGYWRQHVVRAYRSLRRELW